MRSVSSACVARCPERQTRTIVVVEVLDDLVAVLAQQVQRHVVGAGDVSGLELARGSDVENPRWRSRTRRSLRSCESMVVGAVMVIRVLPAEAGGDQSL